MKKVQIYTALFLILVIFLNFDNCVADEKNTNEFTSSATYDKGFRFNIQGWIYLHIEGEPNERGYQHGYLLADEIIDIINRWSNIFPQKNSWESQKRAAMRLFWKKYPNEYQMEIKGIAEGVNARGGKINGKPVSYEDILTLNEMYELNSRFRNYDFYPVRTKLENIFKPVTLDDYHPGHCSVFIATGDSTFDGRIVAAHMTNGHYRNSSWWQYYVTQRWNVILDIQPQNGNRILMTTSPGMIWSDEDYYQNDKGLILMETTLPLGRWRKIGIPVVVRARSAIQYSDSIDEIIQTLKKNNNGLMANDWVMGDTKTGEIASLEMALFNHAVTRTKNGFLWSCNNPKDDKVRWELNSIFGLGIIGRLKSKDFTPTKRDLKFEEFKTSYHGEIDVDIAKKMMSTYPIYHPMFDCKITDSNLVDSFGLWAFYGKTSGSDITFGKDDDIAKPGLTDIPSCGWVNIFGLNSANEFRADKKDSIRKSIEISYEFETSEGEYGNSIYSDPIIEDGILYGTSWNGKIFSFDLENNEIIWEKNIGWSSSSSPAIILNNIIVGSSDGIFVLNKKNGNIVWKENIGHVSSKPTISDDIVFCTTTDGIIYAFNLENGVVIWKYQTEEDIYSSPVVNGNIVYFGSNDKNLYALNKNNGEEVFSFKTEGAITSSPLVHEDLVIFGSWDNNLYAISKNDGVLEWKFSTGWGIDCKPVVWNNIVFFGSTDNSFYALDLENGDLQWLYTANAAIHSNPTVYGDSVFFGCDDGSFYSLNAKDGQIKWTTAPDYKIEGIYNYVTKPIVSNPVVYDGKIFVGSTNGKFYSVNVKTYEPIKTENIEDKKPNLGKWGFIILLFIGVLLLIISILLRKYKKSVTNR
jgi:outer membrane protein assembly factor BamB